MARMSRPAPLSAAEVEAGLARLHGWAGDTTGISRTVEAPSFLAGIGLVGEVARIAEDMDHHPDIDIRWRKVTFALSTHDAGGVTELDLAQAHRIDDLVAAL
jgi:4a-hydroxytetrahydrobiopterin dehydratase